MRVYGFRHRRTWPCPHDVCLVPHTFTHAPRRTPRRRSVCCCPVAQTPTHRQADLGGRDSLAQRVESRASRLACHPNRAFTARAQPATAQPPLHFTQHMRGTGITRCMPVCRQGEFKRTPLWRAAFLGKAEVVPLLLEAGADPRICEPPWQHAPMHNYPLLYQVLT
jgi:hypothetical protein